MTDAVNSDLAPNEANSAIAADIGLDVPDVHTADGGHNHADHHHFVTVDVIYASVDGQGGAIGGKPVWTAQQAALYLNRTGAGIGTGPNHQMPLSGDLTVFNYGFHTSPESLAANGYSYLNPDGSRSYFTEYYAFAEFTAVQKDAAREAVTMWDDVMAVRFAEVEVGQADLSFSNYTDQPGSQAYAYVMQAKVTSQPFYNVQIQKIGGDVWVNANTVSNFYLDEGGYGVNTLVHEIGHAFGLLHPGNYNAGGAAINYAQNAEYFQDTRNYSVLSYWNPRDIGLRDYDYNIHNLAYGSTPMIHDILAVQTMYGADMTTRTGDTIYGFNSNAGRDAFDFVKTPAPTMTIWDAGGHDTLDASGFGTNQIIDLNPGALSSIGGHTVDTVPSFEQVNINRAAAGMAPVTRAFYDANMAVFYSNPELIGRIQDNVGIAYGATIEDAVGGSGNDVMIGNAVDNRLTGNGGNDSLDGSLGNDTLDGGAGSDTASYASAASGVTVDLNDAAHTTVNGTDTFIDIENLTGSAFNDTLTGDAGDNVLDGGLGNDTLTGGAGSDTASYAAASAAVTVSLADAVHTTVNGTDTFVGIENLTGSAFADTLVGDDGANVLSGLGGADTLSGGLGDDRLLGGDGGDLLNGGGGGDVLDGGNGDDLLVGGAGDDSLIGGSGIDTATYAGAAAGMIVSLAAGTASGDGADTLSGVENLVGSASGDSLTGDDLANVIDGGLGDDLLDGGAGIDTASFASAAAGVTVSLAVSGAQATGQGADTLSGFENLAGSAFNDNLSGDAGNNVLLGGLGNDVLSGGAGVDTASYAGAAGSVTVNLTSGMSSGAHGADALTGIESILGSSFGDTLTGNAGANRLDGGLGADAMVGGAGDDVYVVDNTADVADEAATGSSGIDTVLASATYTIGSGIETLELTGTAAINGTGNAGNNTVRGNGANNTVRGLAGDDMVYAGGGDDLVTGDAGNDFMDGGDGVDTLTYQVSASGVVASLASGTAVGEGSDTVINFENLDGSNLNDVLTGDAGNNTITGRTGDDILDGGLGDDRLDGGAGMDIATFAAASAGVTVNLSILTPQETVLGQDTLVSIEGLVGSAHNDVLVGDQFDNVLAGGLGDDVLVGGGGRDTLSFVGAATGATASLAVSGAQNTGQGNDIATGFENLLGSAHADTLTGDAGDNVIDGGAGADSLDGGAGIDTLSHASATAGVIANLSLVTQASGDVISNFENLAGSAFSDTLTGDAGTNVIDGGLGNDAMSGGLGDDRYIVDVAGDVVTEGVDGGTDTVVSAITYTLGANLENLELTGTAGNGTGNGLNNRITGNGSANLLTGNAGDDTLDGGAGNDTLDGGVGDDVLIGGAGTDTLIFTGATVGVTVNLSLTTAQNSGMGIDTVFGVENVIGTGFNDVLTGDALANVLAGGIGNDTLDGGAGNDNLDGGVGNDSLDGGAGNDILVGGAGDDAYAGGAGIDTVTYAALTAATSSVTVNLATGVATGEGADTLTGVENITGTGGADTITGDDANNALTGGGGADTLTGAGGDDTLDGGAGTDILTGGLGNDRYVVDALTDQVIEAIGEGIDTVASAVTFTLTDALEHLDLTGSANVDGTGNALANTLRGNSGANVLNGGGGNDVIDGGLGNDTLRGGEGFDTLSFQQFSPTSVTSNVTIGVAVDLRLTGAQNTNAGLDTISEFENITGSNFHDRLYGDDNANIIDGAAGADVMAGRNGDDIYWVDSVGDGIVENAGEGLDAVGALVDHTLTANVENLSLFGTALKGTGNDLANVIIGTSAANVLSGMAGDDLLDGGSGADILIGGTGNDRYIVDDDGDVSTEAEGEGTDTEESSVSRTLRANLENLILTGTAAIGIGNLLANTITGNAVDNQLSGDGGADTLSGGGGNDQLDGGTGADTMTGGTGDDFYFVDEVGDVVIELAGEGVDTVSSSISYSLGADLDNLVLTGGAVSGSGNDLDNLITGNAVANVLVGGAGNDTISGGDGNDLIDGGTGNDVLLGGAGNDTISGGAGDDRLVGGDGVDRMSGGTGADRFVAEINETKTSGKSGPISLDVVLDYSRGVDTLDFSGIDADSTQAGDQAFTWVGNAAGKGAGQLSMQHFGNVNAAEKALGFDIDGIDGPSSASGPVTVIFGNVDGGAYDFAMVLLDTPSINTTDFVL